MKKGKQYGGMLGRKIKFEARKQNILLAIFCLVVMIVSGAASNDIGIGLTSAAVFGIGIKHLDPSGGQGGGSPEELLMAKIKSEIKSALDSDTKATRETISALEGQLKSLTDKLTDNEALKAEHVELMAQVKALKENGGKPSGVAGKSISEQIKSIIEKDPAKWDAFKKGEIKQFAFELDMKAATTMTVTSNTNGSAFVPNVQVMPGLVDLARNKPFIEQYANTNNTSSSRIVWAEKTNPQGQAAFIAEGAVKPLVSFDIKTNESYAKKVADKIKVSTEMLDDIDFMAGEIEKELRYLVDIKVDTSLLSGTGNGSSAATDLKGLNQYAGAFVTVGINTTVPNNFDAIRAAIAQIISLNFVPSIVFLNPIDAANMDLVKDSQGRPLWMQYKDANGNIYRLTVVETNQMPIGYFLVGDMTRFKVWNYMAFAISYGWVNDDFEKNLVTILGERRLHDYVADNETGAFVYDTFSNVKTAIATL